jgi:hypothetical protein
MSLLQNLRQRSAADWVFTASLVCYVLCLVLPAYYKGTQLKPIPGLEPLLGGWFMVLEGLFSWLANPLYFVVLALRKKQPGLAAACAALAFLVALQFLMAKSLLGDAGGGRASVGGISWGYLAWLLAFLLYVLQYLMRLQPRWRPPEHGVVALMLVVAAGFAYLRFLGPDSPGAVFRERDRQFALLCKQVGFFVYGRPTAPIIGVYDDWGSYYRHIAAQRPAQATASGALVPMVEHKYHIPNRPEPYQRTFAGLWEGQQVSELRSNYFVVSEPLSKHLPESLGLDARAWIVKEQGKEQALGKVVFVRSWADGRTCAPEGEAQFEETRYIDRLLRASP